MPGCSSRRLSCTRFFELYRRHGKIVDPVMRFNDKASDKLVVDFSGERQSYVDRETASIATVTNNSIVNRNTSLSRLSHQLFNPERRKIWLANSN
jgi:hypothetical protein